MHLKPLFLLFLFHLFVAQAQENSQLVITYQTSQVYDTITQKKQTDQCVLLVGSQTSLYYSSKFKDFIDVSKTNVLRMQMLDNMPPSHPFSLSAGSSKIIYSDSNSKKLKITERIMSKTYYYELDNPLLDWKIENEKKDFLDYSCQKATAKYRGREWIVWFTTAIPFQEGPWYFKGLPGLILKADDSQGYFTFEATGIEKKTILIEFSNATNKKITQSQFEEIHYSLSKNTELQHKKMSLSFKNTSADIEDRVKSSLSEKEKKERTSTSDETERLPLKQQLGMNPIEKPLPH